MVKFISCLSFATLLLASAVAQEKALSKGMVITKSTTVKTATYKLDASDSLGQPVLIIEGNNIVIDFANAILKGSNQKNFPDEFFGTGILIRNCKNVVIKNLKVRSYKVAIMADNVEKLAIENCDLSYNYRPRLNSTQEKEDISDWLSYHHNEKDEWLRYGAGIYLKNCNNASVSNCKITGGQNGLMMTGCISGVFYNNDFSFNSGVGIGMYRCNGNQVLYNKVDFNVRGYSHGVYNRGQDSAGILVYEQSNQNIFYKNSVTHCGDGFFLWAGQSTMDSGIGGCNENVISENDFSFAPTNGVEVTFSLNGVFRNRIFECDNGIWAGYSYNSAFAGNKFRDNRVAIAIEHGQHNQIVYNTFSNDADAIKLWARKEQPADWGYAKYRDTRSIGYIITGNSFNKNKTAISLTRTDSIDIFENTYSAVEYKLKVDSTVSNVDSTPIDMPDSTAIIPTVKNPIDPFKGIGALAGRKNMLITEWGPYDFRSPIIWNTNPVDTSNIIRFDLLGPKGHWRIKNVRGLQNISANDGQIPATITGEKMKGNKTDIQIQLEYIGSPIVTPFGESIAAGKPYLFSYKKFFQPLDWDVNWFRLDTNYFNPLKTGQLFSPNARFRPVKSEKVNRIDYAWWGGLNTDDGQIKQFITTAEAQGEFAKGKYELNVTWDDAVRVYVDGKLVIDEWNPAKYDFDESPHRRILLDLNGNHYFRIEHIELGGFATLAFKLTLVD